MAGISRMKFHIRDCCNRKSSHHALTAESQLYFCNQPVIAQSVVYCQSFTSQTTALMSFMLMNRTSSVLSMDSDSGFTGVFPTCRIVVGNGKIDGAEQLGEVRPDKGHGLH